MPLVMWEHFPNAQYSYYVTHATYKRKQNNCHHTGTRPKYCYYVTHVTYENNE